MMALDAQGKRVDMVTSHASLSRTLPASLQPVEDRAGDEGDALRWLVKGPQAGLPDEITVRSTASDGHPLDAIERLPLAAVPCPPKTPPGLVCRASELIGRPPTGSIEGTREPPSRRCMPRWAGA